MADEFFHGIKEGKFNIGEELQPAPFPAQVVQGQLPYLQVILQRHEVKQPGEDVLVQ